MLADEDRLAEIERGRRLTDVDAAVRFAEAGAWEPVERPDTRSSRLEQRGNEP